MAGRTARSKRATGEPFEGMGARIRERREELALTQRGLSKASGVAADVIVNLEHDTRRPRPSTVKRLADALGVSPEYLTTGRERARETVAVVGSPPRGHGSVLGGAAGDLPSGRGDDARERPVVEVRVSGAVDPAAARRLERMIERWMDEDEASGEPDSWPETARAVDEDRTSYRNLFG